MYSYIISLPIANEKKSLALYSYQHYTNSSLKKLAKQVLTELRDADIPLTPKDVLKKISNELINNYDFVSCTEMKIDVDVSEILKTI